MPTYFLRVFALCGVIWPPNLSLMSILPHRFSAPQREPTDGATSAKNGGGQAQAHTIHTVES
ncbi:MAG: hypothetical protein OJF49_004582 [Ktedonobacterales bacterium]|nr:MAG: hypothetical protein OJF49_004582 [Ktedonobacterales bacterium]